MDTHPVTLTALLTCPHCGKAQTVAMPADACLFFYTCTGCQVTLRPLAGDCCVICSYGDVRCLPKTEEERDVRA